MNVKNFLVEYMFKLNIIRKKTCNRPITSKINSTRVMFQSTPIFFSLQS